MKIALVSADKIAVLGHCQRLVTAGLSLLSMKLESAFKQFVGEIQYFGTH